MNIKDDPRIHGLRDQAYKLNASSFASTSLWGDRGDYTKGPAYTFGYLEMDISALLDDEYAQGFRDGAIDAMSDVLLDSNYPPVPATIPAQEHCTCVEGEAADLVSCDVVHGDYSRVDEGA